RPPERGRGVQWGDHGSKRGKEEERQRHAADGEKDPPLVPPEIGQYQRKKLHGTVASRSIRAPLSRCSTVLARSAACASWVTMMMVFLNSSLRRSSRPSTSCELL